MPQAFDEAQLEGSSAQRYNDLAAARDIYLERARRAAELTLPTLYPPDGHSSSTELPTPWQSIGAQGVNTLASKLSLTLIPPNSPFFRLRVDNPVIDQIAVERPDIKSKIDEQVAKREQAVLIEAEEDAVRVTVEEGMKHMLVAGNVLLFIPPKRGIRAYGLQNYVVRRDPMGEVLEIITCDHFDMASLPAKVKQLVGETSSASDAAPTESPASAPKDKPFRIYTHVILEGNRYKVVQEVSGHKIPGSQGSYPKDKSPYIALRMAKVDGEDYGRSYVEQYIGDLRSLELLSRAIVEGSLAAARMLFMVNPSGVTDEDDITEAENTGVISGIDGDVTVLQANKLADFRTAMETIQRLEQRLSYVFLMTAAVQRNAERVTAEEIRVMVRELEEGLGGIYSILSQELQLPLVNRLMDRMQRQRRLPQLDSKDVKAQIVTGIEALGRGTDLARMQQFFATLGSIAGPEAVAQVLVLDEVARRVGTATSVDTNGLIKTQEQLKKEQQMAQMMAMVQQAGPNVAKEAMGIVRDQQDPSKQPQQLQSQGS